MRGLLVRVRDREELRLAPRGAEQLHADRQAVGREPRRRAQRRQPGARAQLAVLAAALLTLGLFFRLEKDMTSTLFCLTSPPLGGDALTYITEGESYPGCNDHNHSAHE